jgi:Secretion system C-terminal sorting domain
VLHINVTNGGKALLYTVDGRLMGTHLLTNGDNSIDIKKLSKGIYVVKVTDNLKTEVRRITKM